MGKVIRVKDNMQSTSLQEGLILDRFLKLVVRRRLLLFDPFGHCPLDVLCVFIATFSYPLLHPDRILAFLVSCVEDTVHSLELVTIGLDEEPVDNRNESEIKAHEDKVRFPSDGIDHDGRELHDRIVEQPIGRCRESIGFSSDSDGSDFRGIQPSDAQPADSEEGVEQEDHHGSGICSALVCRSSLRQSDAGNHHGNTHACSIPHHQTATAKTVDHE